MTPTIKEDSELAKALEQMRTLPNGRMYTPYPEIRRNEFEGLRLERIVHEPCDYRNGHKVGLIFRDTRTGMEWFQSFHLDRVHSDLRGVAQMFYVLARKLEDEWEKALKKMREPMTPQEKRKLKEREYHERHTIQKVRQA